MSTNLNFNPSSSLYYQEIESFSYFTNMWNDIILHLLGN